MSRKVEDRGGTATATKVSQNNLNALDVRLAGREAFLEMEKWEVVLRNGIVKVVVVVGRAQLNKMSK